MTYHPMQFQFVGRVGDEVRNDFINDQGFVVNAATISTSGMEGIESAMTGIKLVALGFPENKLSSGDMYSINCKMIGSNVAENDAIYFKEATRIHLGNAANLPVNFDSNVVNKVSMTGLGIIVAKEVASEDYGIGSFPLIITLKSIDLDPVTRNEVVWYTKHHIAPIPGTMNPNNMFNVGQEVQVCGMVTAYDKVNFMWMTQVTTISACRGNAAGVSGMCRRRGRPLHTLKAFTFQRFMRRFNAKYDNPNTLRLMNSGGVGALRSRAILNRRDKRRRNSLG